MQRQNHLSKMHSSIGIKWSIQFAKMIWFHNKRPTQKKKNACLTFGRVERERVLSDIIWIKMYSYGFYSLCLVFIFYS